MTTIRQRNRVLKTYEVTYSEDVSRYGSIEIEAFSPQEAIEKAKSQDLDAVYFESESSEPFRREILRIEDEDGKIIAEEIPLDAFFTGYGAQDRRLFALAREMLESLKLCERALEERDAEAEEHAAKTARAVLAQAQGDP